MDSDIDNSSIAPNDFASFYRAHRKMVQVFFNGAKAEEMYRKHVLASLGDEFKVLKYQRLPSTSPANASLSYEQKLRAWEAVGQVAKKVKGEDGKALQEAHDEVQPEEDEHLYHTTGWTRGLD